MARRYLALFSRSVPTDGVSLLRCGSKHTQGRGSSLVPHLTYAAAAVPVSIFSLGGCHRTCHPTGPLLLSHDDECKPICKASLLLSKSLSDSVVGSLFHAPVTTLQKRTTAVWERALPLIRCRGRFGQGKTNLRPAFHRQQCAVPLALSLNSQLSPPVSTPTLHPPHTFILPVAKTSSLPRAQF